MAYFPNSKTYLHFLKKVFISKTRGYQRKQNIHFHCVQKLHRGGKNKKCEKLLLTRSQLHHWLSFSSQNFLPFLTDIKDIEGFYNMFVSGRYTTPTFLPSI